MEPYSNEGVSAYTWGWATVASIRYRKGDQHG